MMEGSGSQEGELVGRQSAKNKAQRLNVREGMLKIATFSFCKI